MRFEVCGDFYLRPLWLHWRDYRGLKLSQVGAGGFEPPTSRTQIKWSVGAAVDLIRGPVAGLWGL